MTLTMLTFVRKHADVRNVVDDKCYGGTRILTDIKMMIYFI